MPDPTSERTQTKLIRGLTQIKCNLTMQQQQSYVALISKDVC